MRAFKSHLDLILLIAGFCGMMVIAACPSPPNPPPDGPKPLPPIGDMASGDGGAQTCVIPDGGTLPTWHDVCDGLVHGNRACVKCPSNHSCLEVPDYVWCIAGNDCTKDPNCGPDTGTTAAKAKLQLNRVKAPPKKK